MKPALSNKTIPHPSTWSAMNNGPWVLESIQTRLDEWCPKLFGYHMLKLGGLSCELTSCNCNIQHQVNVDIQNPLHNVIADGYELPFLEKSFDVCYLLYQPYQLLIMFLQSQRSLPSNSL